MEVPNSWEASLRKLLPEGAPLPDEDQLDFSLSFDYIGPSPFFRRPMNPAVPKTRFTSFPRQAPTLSPANSAWLKSRSSSDTTYSDDRRNSTNSVILDSASDDVVGDRGAEADCDRNDRGELGDSSWPGEGKKEMKRGVCFHCIGNRRRRCVRCGKMSYHGLLGLGEVCIVCGAKYCNKCMLRGMGSMPEGRKCIGCIGRPIDEANRGKLGKDSKLLARLCASSEVKQIMQAERECKANQVRPEQVIVNGRELREDELEELFCCAMPPRDLRPGRYWYDKDSGLWGKEGAKPDKMISSKLGVGEKLPADASCGTAMVYMNGREITKFELRMLKLAKVECHRGTRFWLYEDGSYEEEGQNYIRGYIWQKASARRFCKLFSLPVPPYSAHCAKKGPAKVASRLSHENLEDNRSWKILLLGLDGSGASTIFKQAKFIFVNTFTTEELQRIKLIIQTNTFRYLSTLLEEWEHFGVEDFVGLPVDSSVPGETELYGSTESPNLFNKKINNLCDWLLGITSAGDIEAFFPDAAREYAPLVAEIWKDPAIQETYKKMEEQEVLPDVAKYFLDRVIEISSNEYEPSEIAILLAEGVTPQNGLASIEFSFDDCSAVSKIYDQHSEAQVDIPQYQLIQLSTRGQWKGLKCLELFEGMNAVLLCVSLSDYDKQWTDSTGFMQNKMLASRDYLENIARSPSLEGTPFLLLLTKYDTFEDKVTHIPLTVCEWFKDFNPLKTHGKGSVAQQAFHYVAAKFKALYSSITGRKLYIFPVQAHQRGSVSKAFRYLREIVTWEEVQDGEIYTISDED